MRVSICLCVSYSLSQKLYRAAHAVKGAALTLGAGPLADTAKALEHCGRQLVTAVEKGLKSDVCVHGCLVLLTCSLFRTICSYYVCVCRFPSCSKIVQNLIGNTCMSQID